MNGQQQKIFKGVNNSTLTNYQSLYSDELLELESGLEHEELDDDVSLFSVWVLTWTIDNLVGFFLRQFASAHSKFRLKLKNDRPWFLMIIKIDKFKFDFTNIKQNLNEYSFHSSYTLIYYSFLSYNNLTITSRGVVFPIYTFFFPATTTHVTMIMPGNVHVVLTPYIQLHYSSLYKNRL